MRRYEGMSHITIRVHTLVSETGWFELYNSPTGRGTGGVGKERGSADKGPVSRVSGKRRRTVDAEERSPALLLAELVGRVLGEPLDLALGLGIASVDNGSQAVDLA